MPYSHSLSLLLCVFCHLRLVLPFPRGHRPRREMLGFLLSGDWPWYICLAWVQSLWLPFLLGRPLLMLYPPLGTLGCSTLSSFINSSSQGGRAFCLLLLFSNLWVALRAAEGSSVLPTSQPHSLIIFPVFRTLSSSLLQDPARQPMGNVPLEEGAGGSGVCRVTNGAPRHQGWRTKLTQLSPNPPISALYLAQWPKDPHRLSHCPVFVLQGKLGQGPFSPGEALGM